MFKAYGKPFLNMFSYFAWKYVLNMVSWIKQNEEKVNNVEKKKKCWFWGLSFWKGEGCQVGSNRWTSAPKLAALSIWPRWTGDESTKIRAISHSTWIGKITTLSSTQNQNRQRTKFAKQRIFKEIDFLSRRKRFRGKCYKINPV